MNNVNMGGMNAMGGPVGGGMPMMNNGTAGGPRQVNHEDSRAQLNTYIYDYFCRNGMYDVAKALLASDQPIKIDKSSPGRRRDDNINGANEDGDDSKDDLDLKRPDDLPPPNLPEACPESCFLFEWWCLFWDMFNAQRGKGDARAVMNYVTHTQAQNRQRQENQQNMLRNMRPDMMPGQYQQMMMASRQANGINLNQNDIARKAMNNSRNAPTAQQMAMLQQQKQNQMQRDPSDSNQQRSGSPGSAENAPSPSKRPRIDGGTPFNPQGLPNGRGQTQGIPAQQFQNFQGGANPATPKNLQAYQQGLAQHQQGQMPNKNMPNNGGPQNQGSPMMNGQDGGAIAGYYNAPDMNVPGRMPNGPPGGQPGGGGNHALQDYQMQLMLLEQQNKKRLMMARQEQDSMQPRADGQGGPGAPGGMGPNGQSFQGTSPQGQGARSVNSPNPNEMKRGTPHINPGGIPSPVPEGGQSRGSPGPMGFNMQPGQMDPNMGSQQFYKMNGMENGMVGGGMPNMRPPSSHPGAFNGQISQQQMMAARQQQQQAAGNWQGGPNGAQMMPNPSNQGPPQAMRTPQQQNMPPPAPPAAGANANGRTQPSSPQQQNQAPATPSQINKPNPKKKAESKDTKAKRAPKKATSANINAGATPSADASQEAATPTATPSTPLHSKGFSGQNGAGQPVTNGQPSAATTNAGVAPPQQPDSMAFMDNNAGFDIQTFEFADPANGNMNVLEAFDFDSFLHQDEDNAFSFDTGNFLDNNEIPAE